MEESHGKWKNRMEGFCMSGEEEFKAFSRCPLIFKVRRALKEFKPPALPEASKCYVPHFTRGGLGQVSVPKS